MTNDETAKCRRCEDSAFYHGLWWGQRGVASPAADRRALFLPRHPQYKKPEPGVTEGPHLWVKPGTTKDAVQG